MHANFKILTKVRKKNHLLIISLNFRDYFFLGVPTHLLPS